MRSDSQNSKSFEQRRTEFMQNLYNKYQTAKPSNLRRAQTVRQQTSTSRVSYTSNENQLVRYDPSRRPVTTRTEIAKPREIKKIFSTFSPLQNDSDPFFNKQILSSAIIPSESYIQKNLKYLVNTKNIIKIKSLFHSGSGFMKSNTISRLSEKNNDDTFTAAETETVCSFRNEATASRVKLKFKRVVKLIVVFIKFVSIHKGSRQKIESLKMGVDLVLDPSMKDEIFEKDRFSRPKEPVFPDEAKKLLQLAPHERNEEILRYIIISLNFSVPEFIEYPIYMQKMIATYSFFQEYEPGRVIIRQGHMADNYYLIIAGNALEIKHFSTSDDPIAKDEYEYRAISALKRGDTFGDTSIINNTLRHSSVTVHGNKPLSLLCIDKEDFFRIQTPVANDIEKLEFLKTKVSILKNANYPFDLLAKNNQKNQAYCSIYYKKGTIICENSQTSDWLYIVKAGSCRVLKRIKFNQKALDDYLNSKKNKQENGSFTKELLYLSDYKLQLVPATKDSLKSLKAHKLKDDYVYLEMNRLREGDVFGLHDIILTQEEDENSPLILCSDGLECILLNKIFFLKYLPSQSSVMLRFSLHPYPKDEYFINKYFHSFKWRDFRLNCNSAALEKSKRKVLRPSSFNFNF